MSIFLWRSNVQRCDGSTNNNNDRQRQDFFYKTNPSNSLILLSSLFSLILLLFNSSSRRSKCSINCIAAQTTKMEYKTEQASLNIFLLWSKRERGELKFFEQSAYKLYKHITLVIVRLSLFLHYYHCRNLSIIRLSVTHNSHKK